MSNLRTFFWALALGVIGAYLFFFALGAFSFDDVLPLSIVVAVAGGAVGRPRGASQRRNRDSAIRGWCTRASAAGSSLERM